MRQAHPVYVVGPVGEGRGRCKGCGCRLQDPTPYDGEKGGSIWLTPWHDCGGDCVVCMAHAEDADAIEALERWIQLTKSGMAL